MMRMQHLRSYYWLESAIVKNLGDYLAALVLDGLGYTCAHRNASDRAVSNQGRCLLTIGSVLSEQTLAKISGTLDIWGSGWRGVPIPKKMMGRMRFHAVRGPRTLTGLGLPANTPLGDPALLLPTLRTENFGYHGRTIVIPHFYRTDQMPAKERCARTGCHEVLSVRIIGKPVPGRRPSSRRLPSTIGSWIRLKIPLRTVWQTIRRLAGADFVLTGSLHGAVLAQAYGVPWAAYDDGYVDIPEKWYDWGDYLGIRLSFVTNLREGGQWWQDFGKDGRLHDIESLLSAFPYPLPEAGDDA